MNKIFRVRYKLGDLEIEVESSDKEYVDSKLADMLKTVVAKKSGTIKKDTKGKRKKLKRTDEADLAKPDENAIDIPALIEGIKDSSHFPAIDENILKERAQLPRVMLALYFADKVLGNPHMTTGQIATLTDQLDVKMGAPDVNKTIKGNSKYFSQDKIRKRGARVGYKLNRRGKEHFEKIL